MKPLKTGIAYHGNRMPSHYRVDLEEIQKADMDIVVHMFSHTDWDRHHLVMKDIFKMTEDAGLEVWVDNWGIGGPPGDKSFFLGLHPEAHMVYSDGTMHPTFVDSKISQPTTSHRILFNLATAKPALKTTTTAAQVTSTQSITTASTTGSAQVPISTHAHRSGSEPTTLFVRSKASQAPATNTPQG